MDVHAIAVFPKLFLHVGVVLGPMVVTAKLTVSAIYAQIYNSSQHLQPCCGQRLGLVTFVSLTDSPHTCQSPIASRSRSRRPHRKKTKHQHEQKLIQARDMAEYGPTCATASRYQCFSLRKNCSWDSIAEDLV